MDSYFHISGT